MLYFLFEYTAPNIIIVIQGERKRLIPLSYHKFLKRDRHFQQHISPLYYIWLISFDAFLL